MSGTFITTGNLPGAFPGMTTFLEANLAVLPRPVLVQTLAADVAQIAAGNGCEVFGLLEGPAYRRHIRDADMVIAHCGVGLLNDCLGLGKVANFLPRSAARGEHIDDHQHELAAMVAARDLGRIIGPDTRAGNLIDGSRPPRAIRLDLARHLPSKGSFLVVGSSGGHRSEAAPTAAALRAAGCVQLCSIVDEPIWQVDETHQVVPSCGTKLGMVHAAFCLLTLLRRYRPDFVVTHGAGAGLSAVVAARLLGIPTFACESLTRVVDSGRWFKGAVLAGAWCFAPDHATFLSKPFFRKVTSVAFEVVDLEEAVS